MWRVNGPNCAAPARPIENCARCADHQRFFGGIAAVSHIVKCRDVEGGGGVHAIRLPATNLKGRSNETLTVK